MNIKDKGSVWVTLPWKPFNCTESPPDPFIFYGDIALESLQSQEVSQYPPHPALPCRAPAETNKMGLFFLGETGKDSIH